MVPESGSRSSMIGRVVGRSVGYVHVARIGSAVHVEPLVRGPKPAVIGSVAEFIRPNPCLGVVICPGAVGIFMVPVMCIILGVIDIMSVVKDIPPGKYS